MNVQENQRIAVVIPAKDESERIGATIRAAWALPRVDLVIVVDDGSEDDTQKVARAAGATVVRHSHNRGKASAMGTGASVAGMRDAKGAPPRALLFLDADLGDSAAECAPLIDPILAGNVDCTIAYLPPQAGAGGHGFVTSLGRKAIEKLTGWSPQQPLSGQRCITRVAFDAVQPLATGWGVEVGMTIDLLTAGFTVQEVPCNLKHRATANDLSGQIHRAMQYKDVLLAVNSRKLRRVGVSKAQRNSNPSIAGEPYNAYQEK
ncbi:glycosyltransferase involved in cell wall biosynthesis [Arcanobacterium pluranimalium]|uniref:glycosyltransferase family 2 protein n=1 Tax=Arcanobacterium pluranimalium TaxID=108028 RepID=UPI003083FF80|nr:glycosyltransferase involved in cell wall biosynthesis [Arcanobacterium pluranimalium]